MSGGAAFEREELTQLLKASRLPEAAITDFERCNVSNLSLCYWESLGDGGWESEERAHVRVTPRHLRSSKKIGNLGKPL